MPIVIDLGCLGVPHSHSRTGNQTDAGQQSIAIPQLSQNNMENKLYNSDFLCFIYLQSAHTSP